MMIERRVTVVNSHGIHARPAAEIVKCASKFTSHITLVRDDLDVNAKSIMGVMMLAAECGAEILIRAEGVDEARAVEALVVLIAGKFGER